jgi:arylsulfatase A-like enzyme
MMQSLHRFRSFVAGFAAAALLPFLSPVSFAQRDAPSGPRGKRPNFVFLLVDDLGWSDIACFGNTFHETPNIDRLAAEGMRFTNAYAACAVCSPTRASIQTGKYPIRLGLTDYIPGERHRDKPLVTKFTATEMPLEERTLAEALQAHGYRTAFLGKWHLGGRKYYPQHQGYDINVAGNFKGHPWDGYFSPYNLEHLENGPEGEYLTDRLTDEALKILDRFGEDPTRPFLLFMSYYTVHMPIQAKPEVQKKYEAKKRAREDPRWKNTGYAGMVDSLDQSVGRILEKIRSLGVAQNTVVFFMSDNGGVDYAKVSTNDPLRGGKGRYWEGGIREPMIVRWPGVTRAGSVCAVPVVSMDFYPTLLDIAGLPLDPEQHRDGLSLVPLLEGGGTLERDALFWHYPHYHCSGARPVSAVRLGSYKFLRHYESGRKELYNLEKDVSETENLIAAEPEKARELEARLDGWLKEVGAYLPVPQKPVEPGARGKEFDVLRAATVDGSDLGYLVRSPRTGFALTRRDAPLSGSWTLSGTLEIRPPAGAWKNAFLVFGDGPAPDRLVAVGVQFVRKRVVIKRPGAPWPIQTFPLAKSPPKRITLRVTVSPEAGTLTIVLGGETFERKLPGSARRVTHLGYMVEKTAVAFAPLEVKAAD